MTEQLAVTGCLFGIDQTYCQYFISEKQKVSTAVVLMDQEPAKLVNTEVFRLEKKGDGKRSIGITYLIILVST